jgi:hypothetical protein
MYAIFLVTHVTLALLAQGVTLHWELSCDIPEQTRTVGFFFHFSGTVFSVKHFATEKQAADLLYLMFSLNSS